MSIRIIFLAAALAAGSSALVASDEVDRAESQQAMQTAEGLTARDCILLGMLNPGAPLPPECQELESDPRPVQLGREVAVEHNLADGDEYMIPLPELIAHGKHLFEANWTIQEGAGRPLLKGTGAPLSDPDAPLVFPDNFNRISAPDANSCAGCHNMPRTGGGGDFVTNVFVLAQRFDFATFHFDDAIPTRGGVDESGAPAPLHTIGNSRATLGMFGSGFIEMLARQMTAELQAIRDAIPPGGAASLESKQVPFGTLARDAEGNWDVSGVEGLAAPSLASAGPDDPPDLIIRPFHQAGAVISLRQFSNNAFNHHHGIQSVERFGAGVDADGDGSTSELSQADITAVSAFQAQLAVPGRVIPRHPVIEDAVALGERLFVDIGCGGCHIPALPLTDEGWVFVEPNPFNPPGNLQPGQAPDFSFDLTDPGLDPPRLNVDHEANMVWVPAFTDFKLHDITAGPDDSNREPLDMHAHPGSPEFFEGNSRFITRKLWGAANEPPFFHHGHFTTMREAIESHRGDAEDVYQAWRALDDHGRDTIIEFLKTLQVLPPGTRHLVVDERHQPRTWASDLPVWNVPVLPGEL